mmetsp:Transcript_74037/g.209027  ORF Transcript_74037/g.209027 Transcript_74037/m.209027 type:complete len:330 (-) Transcript_74037:1033-2022(-)
MISRSITMVHSSERKVQMTEPTIERSSRSRCMILTMRTMRTSLIPRRMRTKLRLTWPVSPSSLTTKREMTSSASCMATTAVSKRFHRHSGTKKKVLPYTNARSSNSKVKMKQKMYDSIWSTSGSPIWLRADRAEYSVCTPIVTAFAMMTAPMAWSKRSSVTTPSTADRRDLTQRRREPRRSQLTTEVMDPRRTRALFLVNSFSVLDLDRWTWPPGVFAASSSSLWAAAGVYDAQLQLEEEPARDALRPPRAWLWCSSTELSARVLPTSVSGEANRAWWRRRSSSSSAAGTRPVPCDDTSSASLVALFGDRYASCSAGDSSVSVVSGATG